MFTLFSLTVLMILFYIIHAAVVSRSHQGTDLRLKAPSLFSVIRVLLPKSSTFAVKKENYFGV